MMWSPSWRSCPQLDFFFTWHPREESCHSSKWTMIFFGLMCLYKYYRVWTSRFCPISCGWWYYVFSFKIGRFKQWGVHGMRCSFFEIPWDCKKLFSSMDFPIWYVEQSSKFVRNLQPITTWFHSRVRNEIGKSCLAGARGKMMSIFHDFEPPLLSTYFEDKDPPNASFPNCSCGR